MFPTPAVAGDQLLVASCAGWFYSLDRATGEPRWKFNIGDAGASDFHSQVAIVGDRVIFGTDGARGNGHALDLETGHEIWMRPCGKALRTAILELDDTIVGVARKESDELFCSRISDGETVWSVEYPAGAYNNSPVIVDGDVYFGTSDGRIVVHDGGDGAFKREFDVGDPVNSSLSVFDDRVYGATRSGRVFRIGLDDGKVDGFIELGGKIHSPPTLIGPTIVVQVDWRSSACRLVALTRDLSEVAWEWRPKQADNWGTVARVVRRGDTVVLATRHGHVGALDAADGSHLWSVQVDGAVRSVLFHDDMLYVGTISGPVYALQDVSQ